jgi:hypothetical protein
MPKKMTRISLALNIGNRHNFGDLALPTTALATNPFKGLHDFLF